MNGFSLSVAAVDRVWFQATARTCTVRTTTGWRTFEANHEPFAAVVSGALYVVDENGGRHTISAGGGLLRFDRNSCVIVVADRPPIDKS
jgi:F0F1-type ATP synthase epsilon subunit